jgi:hypothetical protein
MKQAKFLYDFKCCKIGKVTVIASLQSRRGNLFLNLLSNCK